MENIEEKTPLFILTGETAYPNFEIEVSGCKYLINIYLDEDTYMTIDWYQSHNNIKDSLLYLAELTEYLQENPDLIPNVFKSRAMEITIETSNGPQSGLEEYELCDDGLCIKLPDDSNLIVEWHKFFKLLIDETWKINKFIESEKEE